MLLIGVTCFTADSGEEYRLGEEIPTIVVRATRLAFTENHILVNVEAHVREAWSTSGSTLFHCARRQLDRGSGPYFYLPKTGKSPRGPAVERRRLLGAERAGFRMAIGATVLIETIAAAFEMDEILYELREHSAGLNARRWDYIFSLHQEVPYAGRRFVLPDRLAGDDDGSRSCAPTRSCSSRPVTGAARMRSAGWPRSYLIDVTRRQLSWRLTRCARDKDREANDGFDGSWVAHPDLVPICSSGFRRGLGSAPKPAGPRAR